MKSGRRTKCFTVRAAAILLCLVAFSFYVRPGLYARFTKQAVSDNQARVAKFDIQPGESYIVSGIAFENFFPGEEQEFDFTVDFKCEVATRCKMSIESTGNLPLEFRIVVKEKEIPIGNTLTEILTLVPNEGEVAFVLIATWPEDQNGTEYLDEIDVLRLTIVSEQID